MNLTSSLMSTEWLASRLDAPDIRIVDASWYLPDQSRDPKAEFAAEHIPGAVFFDIDEISDKASPYPHMLPPPEKFSSRVRDLGLGDGSRIIIYDTAGIYSAPRVLWMFKVMGHKDVAVLDGGLAKWKREGRPLDDMPPRRQTRHFTARVNRMLVRDADGLARDLVKDREQILDVRSPERFAGTAPEPRAGLRSGHIPGSRNLYYKDLLSADGTMKTVAELKRLFTAHGLEAERPVVASCGSGITAAIAYLALDLAGYRDIAVYDGSWAEWGARTDLPVAVGA